MSKLKQQQSAIRSKCGMSLLVPYIYGENPRERHRRRHNAALAARSTIESWCEFRCVELTVTGSNHPETCSPEGWKWDFRLPNKFAQWRPFAGNLALKKDLHGSLYVIKLYDHEQLLNILEWWIE